MIKFAIRQNVKYPLQLLIWFILREIESDLVSRFLNFNSIIYTPIMFLGEFLAGLIIYLYQKQYLSKDKTIKLSHFTSIQLNRVKSTKLMIDNKIKIAYLISFAAFCDYTQFVISLHISKFMNTSNSFEIRLFGLFTIYDALFYYYILKFPIFKHQYLSLFIIGFCLIILIISEFIFQEINIFLSYGQFFIYLFLIIIIHFISALLDSIEKYLFEFNNLNIFFVLMLEGIIGFILSFIYSLFQSPFDDIIQFIKENSYSYIIILILALILYLILSGLINSYRVLTTKIYSPMTTTFMYYIFNPFFLSYYFIIGADFISYGKINTLYFIINLIISIILSFIGCVYNEFLILFFCGLERDTYKQIIIRSGNEGNFYNINDFLDDDEIDDNTSTATNRINLGKYF